MGCNLVFSIIAGNTIILVVRSAKCADAGTEMDFAVRMLYLADVPDYVLYSTANEQG